MQKLIGFVRRRRIGLSIIGAFIVLITFFAKEVIRDDFDGRIGAINDAQHQHEVRDSAAIVGDQVDDMFAYMANKDLQIDPTNFTRPQMIETYAAVTGELSMKALSCAQIVSDAQNFGIQAGLPSTPTDQQAFVRLTVACNLYGPQRFQGNITPQNATGDQAFAVLKQNFQNALRIDGPITAARALTATMEHRVADRKAGFEARLNVIDLALIVLFAFGWVLNLLGQLVQTTGGKGAQPE